MFTRRGYNLRGSLLDLDVVGTALVVELPFSNVGEGHFEGLAQVLLEQLHFESANAVGSVQPQPRLVGSAAVLGAPEALESRGQLGEVALLRWLAVSPSSVPASDVVVELRSGTHAVIRRDSAEDFDAVQNGLS